MYGKGKFQELRYDDQAVSEKNIAFLYQIKRVPISIYENTYEFSNGAIHNLRHIKPKTRQIPDTSNLRHIKPQTHQTSDKEYRAANYTTDNNTFSCCNWNPNWKLENPSDFRLKYEKVESKF